MIYYVYLCVALYGYCIVILVSPLSFPTVFGTLLKGIAFL